MIAKYFIKISFLVLILLIFLLIGIKITQNSKLETSHQPSILVTVEPMAYLVERIAGDSFDVNVLIPAGKEPETFAPNPSTVTGFAKNSLIFFRVGLTSEETLLSKLETLAPKMKVVDLRQNLRLTEDLHNDSHYENSHFHNDSHTENDSLSENVIHSQNSDHSEKTNNPDNEPIVEEIEKKSAEEESDKQSKELAANAEPASHADHSCGSNGLDPHIWMSPAFVRQIIPVIVDELSRLTPQQAKEFESRAQQLDQELAELQNSITSQLKELKYRNLFVFHPAYGYYCQEFNLKQHAIENEGKSPKPQELADFIQLAKQEKIKTIIIQPEFNPTSAKTIADAAEAKLEVHSPLEKNYFDNLNRLTLLIANSF